MAQERQGKQPSPRDRSGEAERIDVRKADEGHMEKVDDLLDEIDSVLEENAEEFVKNYVQKGGQ